VFDDAYSTSRVTIDIFSKVGFGEPHSSESQDMRPRSFSQSGIISCDGTSYIQPSLNPGERLPDEEGLRIFPEGFVGFALRFHELRDNVKSIGFLGFPCGLTDSLVSFVVIVMPAVAPLIQRVVTELRVLLSYHLYFLTQFDDSQEVFSIKKPRFFNRAFISLRCKVFLAPPDRLELPT